MRTGFIPHVFCCCCSLSLSPGRKWFSEKILKLLARSLAQPFSSLLQLSSRLDDDVCSRHAKCQCHRRGGLPYEKKKFTRREYMSNICENKRRNPHVHVKINIFFRLVRCASVRFDVLSLLFCHAMLRVSQIKTLRRKNSSWACVAHCSSTLNSLEWSIHNIKKNIMES